ncbi:hypothetical protein PHYBLDRAFT_147586 [Phycomyces blakesleeanus NRRL 1555(-)]|uniref:Uncharacterized protein n=1 Tax=Phycomyces blakesleeanus (strain ATCC 8743b / DSM 1359 / FGSC 10004 / NBRC 33097 / NRRL 1555) TaxID=763407 RepID=A0A162U2L3_PHYB8|nr:hypothetical protein PHYBLDRAFT_147586 [Phycomyces blakesleeanus NRRL 1555(-)]OAD71823.1 hypothetical protein PHYBLDRAFT_147586 [Phycomyces blakesleeanus NRRL 1555(-)]|eukprot:XP_018289863.1 hypothetical protein PHYBLDRAFT_147586 [Phycomyces blakesleeanus NRRL 1555(-)]
MVRKLDMHTHYDNKLVINLNKFGSYWFFASQVYNGRKLLQIDIPKTSNFLNQSKCLGPDGMTEAATSFYKGLYTPEPIDQLAIDDLLRHLPHDLCLSDTICSSLTAELCIEDI